MLFSLGNNRVSCRSFIASLILACVLSTAAFGQSYTDFEADVASHLATIDFSVGAIQDYTYDSSVSLDDIESSVETWLPAFNSQLINLYNLLSSIQNSQVQANSDWRNFRDTVSAKVWETHSLSPSNESIWSIRDFLRDSRNLFQPFCSFVTNYYLRQENKINELAFGVNQLSSIATNIAVISLGCYEDLNYSPEDLYALMDNDSTDYYFNYFASRSFLGMAAYNYLLMFYPNYRGSSYYNDLLRNFGLWESLSLANDTSLTLVNEYAPEYGLGNVLFSLYSPLSPYVLEAQSNLFSSVFDANLTPAMFSNAVFSASDSSKILQQLTKINNITNALVNGGAFAGDGGDAAEANASRLDFHFDINGTPWDQEESDYVYDVTNRFQDALRLDSSFTDFDTFLNDYEGLADSLGEQLQEFGSASKNRALSPTTLAFTTPALFGTRPYFVTFDLAPNSRICTFCRGMFSWICTIYKLTTFCVFVWQIQRAVSSVVH